MKRCRLNTGAAADPGAQCPLRTRDVPGRPPRSNSRNRLRRRRLRTDAPPTWMAGASVR